MKTKNPALKIALYLIGVVLALGLIWYVTLPPLNPHDAGFWTFFLLCDAAVFVSYFVIKALAGGSFTVIVNGRASFRKFPKFPKVQIIVTVLLIAVLIVLSIFSSTVFQAKTYSSLIGLTEGDFSSDIAETETVSDIALMDSSSARIIGARTLGTLSDLVSQYNVADTYTQIAVKGTPYKVAPLEYASFFKWLKNDGIPGYVKVDPVQFDAEFIRLTDKRIRYSPSAYFSDNLHRALRFAYPTAIFGTVYFEVDDGGNPYWVAPVMEPQAGFFGAYDVTSVVTMDACTGKTAKYTPAEAPAWIDIVYNGNLICQKYDWYGMLRNGYINSAFGQTDCVVTTSDFGYKIIGDDVYVFTGVTSVSNDEANIGFILVNSRTGEYKYYAVPGAEEYSAMAAAEGSVQQYRYDASFPSLINVNGEATYIMVLKDASGIVKMYSMVNVRNYNIVSTSTTEEECLAKYKALLATNGVVNENAMESNIITVEELLFIPQNGNTTVYIRSDKGVFSLPFEEKILLVKEGDKLAVTYTHKSDVTMLHSYTVATDTANKAPSAPELTVTDIAELFDSDIYHVQTYDARMIAEIRKNLTLEGDISSVLHITNQETAPPDLEWAYVYELTEEADAAALAENRDLFVSSMEGGICVRLGNIVVYGNSPVIAALAQ